MKAWKFIVSIILGYSLPVIFIGRNWTGWSGIIIVYAIDMAINRRKWPEEMNTSKISRSEWMTYIGGGIAAVMLFASLLGLTGGPISFFWYFWGCGTAYIVWSQL